MASKMVSLKLTPKEAKERFGPISAQSAKADMPKYPYDTRVTLNTEVLTKMGVKPSDFAVGETFEITAKVEVIGTREEERQSGERCELELQITDIDSDLGKSKKKAKAEANHLNAISGSEAEEDYAE